MGQKLSNTGIQQGQVINAQHVSQSVDALTGAQEYDITVKGIIEVQNSAGGKTFKFDGNNFTESESNTFLVRNPDGTVGYRSGGATGPQGPQGSHGTSGNSGSSGTSGNSGSSGTSGVNGTGGGDPVVPPLPTSSGTSGTSGNTGANGATFESKFSTSYNTVPTNGMFTLDGWGATVADEPFTIFLNKIAVNSHNIGGFLGAINSSPSNNTAFITIVSTENPEKYLRGFYKSIIDETNYVRIGFEVTDKSSEAFGNNDICTFHFSAVPLTTTSGTSGTSSSAAEVRNDSIIMALNKNVTSVGAWDFEVGSGFPTSNGKVRAVTADKNSISGFIITKTNAGGFNYSNIISPRQSDFEETTLRLRASGDAAQAEYKVLSTVNYPSANPPCVQYIVEVLGSPTGNINQNQLAEFDFYDSVYVYNLLPGYTNLTVTANNTYSSPQPDYPELCFYLKNTDFESGQEAIVNLNVTNPVRLTYMHAGGNELGTGTNNTAGENLSKNWRRRTCQIITGNNSGLNSYTTNSSGIVPSSGRYQLVFKHWNKNGDGIFGGMFIRAENNGQP